MYANPVECVVRLALRADTPLIVPLVEHYWRFEGINGFDIDAVHMLLNWFLSQPQLGAIWLATIAGKPVGYASVTFMFSLEHRGMMAEIDELFVLAESRSQGVAASLLATAENELRARKLVRLQLQIARDNQYARTFYKRRGFEERAYELLDKSLIGGNP